VFHPYKVLYDSIINEYSGELEDPRFQVAPQYGELNFGFVLTNGKGDPTPDGEWHIWRLCRPHGWAHVINVADRQDRVYLDLLCKRLWLQAKYSDKYGHTGYSKMLEELDQKNREKAQQDKQDMFDDISAANSTMLNRIKDNMLRGHIAATNPVKETISSFAGQKNRSRLVTPLDDKSGGLILPPGFGDD
jgi:hypothetical protein